MKSSLRIIFFFFIHLPAMWRHVRAYSTLHPRHHAVLPSRQQWSIMSRRGTVAQRRHTDTRVMRKGDWL